MFKHAKNVRQLSYSICCHQKLKNLKGKKKSSQEWLIRQNTDEYVKLAKIENYRARSAFKLIEMDDHYRFLRPGQTVLDCGAAPGAWSQVLAKRTNANGEQVEKRVGKVMAVDLSPFHPIVGVTSFPLSDFTSPETQKQILETIDSKFDVIVSDMAPKVSGMNSLDHEIIIDLCRKVVRFSECALKPNGTLLMKIFDGGLTKDLEKILVNMFHKVKYVKPDSSRKNSAEIYFLCLKFKIKLSNT